MFKPLIFSGTIVFLCPCLLLAEDWNRFRGPNGTGVIAGPPSPTEWSVQKNLKWKVPLPGKGSSSPIVAGDRVFVTCYTGYGLSVENPGKPEELVRHLIAFDRGTGSELWRASIPSTAPEDPYQGFITQHGYASSSPATDGQNVFAVMGKSGLFAFDRDGVELWRAELGTKSDRAKWGDGSSPIIVDDLIVVDAGILGNQFAAFNKTTGEKIWSIEDSAFTNCWETPVVVKVGESNQILFHVPKKILAVDPIDGKVVWSAASPLDDAASTSIVVDRGNAYLMGSRAGRAMAIKCGGSGDVTQTNTLWQTSLRSGTCTPIAVGDNLYWTSGGIFYAANLSTGDYVFRERLPRLGGPTGGFPNADYSSPIAIGDKIYLFTRNGESYVLQAGDEFKVVAHNAGFDGDTTAFSGTPAASDGELFVRSEANLYCLRDTSQRDTRN